MKFAYIITSKYCHHVATLNKHVSCSHNGFDSFYSLQQAVLLMSTDGQVCREILTFHRFPHSLHSTKVVMGSSALRVWTCGERLCIPAHFMLQCSLSPLANLFSDMQANQRLVRICSRHRNAGLFVFQKLEPPGLLFQYMD